MSQTIVVLKRPQEFANGLFFGSATAHGRAATAPACVLVGAMVDRFIVLGRKVEYGIEYQESRGSTDGRGTVKVDWREHDNRGHGCPSRAVGSGSSRTGPRPCRSTSGDRQGLRDAPQGAVPFRRSRRPTLLRTRITSMIV